MKQKHSKFYTGLAASLFVVVTLFIFYGQCRESKNQKSSVQPKKVDSEHTNCQVEQLKKTEQSGESKKMAKEVLTLLFTHLTGSGTIEKKDKDNYSLVLTDPNQDITYFLNKPFRDAKQISLATFLRGIGFETEHPPVATIILEGKKNKTTIVARLKNPIIDEDKNILTYQITVLHNNDGYSELAKIPKSFESASFFIDNTDCSFLGMVFCDKSGSCLDKSRCEMLQKGGRVLTSWNEDKKKECYKITLADAYAIAQEKDSGCSLKGDAKLSKVKYECDDTVGGWRIRLDTGLLGEAGECGASCLVVPKTKYRKGKVTTDVEYDCTDRAVTDKNKNTHCSALDFKEGYDNNNAKKNLIKKYHKIITGAEKHNTSQEYHYCIQDTTPFKYSEYWATDSSGLGGYALLSTLPYHYKLIDAKRLQHNKAERPLVEDFYTYIRDMNKDGSSDDKKCWEKVISLKNAQQGDFLVVRYDDRAGENVKGHLMWIDKKPKKYSKCLADSCYEVTVIDSASNGHEEDTRTSKNSYNCNIGNTCGVGQGKMLFYTNEKGEPISYNWGKTIYGTKKYVKYKDKKQCTEGKEECLLEGIVIGRVKDCKKK